MKSNSLKLVFAAAFFVAGTIADVADGRAEECSYAARNYHMYMDRCAAMDGCASRERMTRLVKKACGHIPGRQAVASRIDAVEQTLKNVYTGPSAKDCGYLSRRYADMKADTERRAQRFGRSFDPMEWDALALRKSLAERACGRSIDPQAALAARHAEEPEEEKDRWYEEVEYRDHDISNSICSGIRAMTKFRGVRIGGRVARGLIYARLSRAELSKIEATPLKALRVGTHRISDSDAAFLRRYFAARGEAGVPFWVGITVTVGGALMGNTLTATAASVGIAYLDDLIRNSAGSKTARLLSGSFRTGDTLESAWIIRRDSENHPYLSLMTYYRPAGGEKTYYLCGRTYAVAEQ